MVLLSVCLLGLSTSIIVCLEGTDNAQSSIKEFVLEVTTTDYHRPFGLALKYLQHHNLSFSSPFIIFALLYSTTVRLVYILHVTHHELYLN